MKKNFFFVILMMAAVYSEAQVNFQTLTWNDAKQQAASSDKYIFMDCYTDWCGWCKVMDKEVFPDAKVSSFMNEHFLPMKVDMERGEGILLSLKYRVSGYPTYLIFDKSGKLVYTIVGYLPADKFLSSLNESIDPAKQTNYQGISSDLNLPYPDFCLKFIDGNHRNRPDSTTVVTYLDQQKDLFSEVNWTVLRNFGYLDPKYSQFILDNESKYAELYGKEEVSSVVKNYIIGSKLRSAIKDFSEAELKAVLKMVDKYVKDDPENTKLGFRISFYSSTQNYSKMMDVLDEFATLDKYDNVDQYNSCCWEIYEKCDDPQLVKRAVSHMQKAAFVNKGYAEMDTYAALLYKDKQYEKAEKIANDAIAIGKEKDEDVSSTEALLEKIKKAKEVNN